MECQIESSPQSRHAKGSVRHAEKRRTGTCLFADRVARVSIDTYKSCVPLSFRETQKQTCIATIVAHFLPDGDTDGVLQVMALGVGTKFLPETVLREEEQYSEAEQLDSSQGYGARVRDCHAEVLARRAFRRQLCLEIQTELQPKNGTIFRHGMPFDDTPRSYKPILRRVKEVSEDNTVRYELLSEVTLHMYTSSAPCGNATLKKFTKMEKEKFNDKLGPNEWPLPNHEPIPPHSLRLGQFALLTKKDNSRVDGKNPSGPIETKEAFSSGRNAPKAKIWPANQSDEWCPPGTSIASFDKGSLHSCSDKICRWNCLGLQGGLIASLLNRPVYISTLTVGRKLTGCICRRAICCRATPPAKFKPIASTYGLKHPSIMGTSVYLDDSGLIEMTNSTEFGQDVRFDSTLCWAWWASIETGKVECIDGATGSALGGKSNAGNNPGVSTSMISTAVLLGLFRSIATMLPQNDDSKLETSNIFSLRDLRSFKRHASPEYEAAKDELMTKHRIFRQWRRRENEGKIKK